MNSFRGRELSEPARPAGGPVTAWGQVWRFAPAIYQAIEQLRAAGVLLPLSESRRNRAWEAAGLLDLLAGLEAGEFPGTERRS